MRIVPAATTKSVVPSAIERERGAGRELGDDAGHSVAHQAGSTKSARTLYRLTAPECCISQHSLIPKCYVLGRKNFLNTTACHSELREADKAGSNSRHGTTDSLQQEQPCAHMRPLAIM